MYTKLGAPLKEAIWKLNKYHINPQAITHDTMTWWSNTKIVKSLETLYCSTTHSKIRNAEVKEKVICYSSHSSVTWNDPNDGQIASDGHSQHGSKNWDPKQFKPVVCGRLAPGNLRGFRDQIMQREEVMTVRELNVGEWWLPKRWVVVSPGGKWGIVILHRVHEVHKGAHVVP